MRVMGPPRFLPHSGLAFGELQFIDSTYRDVHVTNYDSVDLTLTASMMYNTPSFELMNTTLTVPPRENGEFSVMAQTVLDEGWYSDTLIMNTSHPDLPIVHINTWVNSVPRVEPIILDIADVPDDQGGWVILEFTRSYYDSWYSSGRTELYTIELYDGNNWVASNSSVAYQQNRYFSLVHTLEDSNSVSEGVTDFRVVAGMHEGTWFSEVGSGYSMDNLPPDIPTGLMAEQEAEFIRVSWQHNTDEEIQYYEVHKSSNMDFIDNQYSIFTIADTLLIDSDFTIGETFYYRLGAVDLAGNMSDYSSVVSITLLSIDGGLIPEDFALHQNYPNPFNPVTTLRYDLPENSLVDITIFDMLGRQVKTLVDQTQDAGFKSVVWNATDDYGKPVSAGIYLYKIQSGEYISTKKMVLLK